MGRVELGPRVRLLLAMAVLVAFAALVFGYVLQPNWGLINGALRALGVQNLPLWLADPRYSHTGSGVWTGDSSHGPWPG